jgi:hypothetical protein
MKTPFKLVYGLEAVVPMEYFVPSLRIVVVITLTSTRNAYLASGHLRFLLFQSTTEQLFLKTSFIKTHAPCSITAHVYTLANPKQPVRTYKSTKKGKLLTEHIALGELTKPSGHAWLRVRPNT